MNTNDIISLITYIISKNFEDVEIYKDKIIQDVSTPSFYIGIINNEHEQQLGNRYKRIFKVAIKYFPQNDTIEECNDTAEKLTEILELMRYNNMTAKGYKMNYKTEENRLHFYFNVDVSLEKIMIEETKMKDVEVTQNVR